MKKKLDWMNQNAFSQADLYMGSTTAIGSRFKIGIRDRFPVRFYAGYDDSGSDITGDVRWTGGFNWGNITKWGDRRNTDSHYRYGNFMLERKTDLIAGISLRNEARYQISNGNLLGSEQFGLGGWETVRGYDERESSGDQGWLVRNEIWSPRLSLSEWITMAKWGDLHELNDNLQGYLFWDYGVTMNRRLLPNENPDTELSSVGLGLRYRISNYFSLRADYGVQLLDTGANKRNDGRFHLGATVSY